MAIRRPHLKCWKTKESLVNVRGLCCPGENGFFAEEWKRKDMIQAGGAGRDGGVGLEDWVEKETTFVNFELYFHFLITVILSP